MAPSKRNVGVVVPAGGLGVRAGTVGPKQFREVGGVPMLKRALLPFLESDQVLEIVVPLPDEFIGAPPDWLQEMTNERVKLVAGGSTRGKSVAKGVKALSEACVTVLIHDAARPFVSKETIEAVIEKARSGRVAIAAVPVRDTLKRSDANNELILETVDRANLWQAQTPQGFPRNILSEMYHLEIDPEFALTDEAALAEAAGHAVHIVPDSTTNFKVTLPEDFVLAEALCRT
ncbi:MAG: 2-C-methyl-D-erythritol 4-phosphate cytidylyltransferase [Gemmatimonadota bacterium]|nr:2-C-methyl-D-erythritol 4-phosphate cytidylyltransferase [Gemmatimonadota bacterium]